jgi:hypothetical protein
MTIETYPDQLEPENHDAVIWRFVSMAKFRDLITTSKLYFRRADLFANDEREGLPPEEYLPSLLGLNPLIPRHRRDLNHDIGSAAQFRQTFTFAAGTYFEMKQTKCGRNTVKTE